MVQIVKSLVFQGSQSGDCVLALVSGSKRVREVKLQELVGEPVSMASADTVRAVTGFAIGGVPPLGHARAMPTFIDEELLGYQCLWAAAGSPRAVFSLSPEELARISDGRVVDLG